MKSDWLCDTYFRFILVGVGRAAVLANLPDAAAAQPEELLLLDVLEADFAARVVRNLGRRHDRRRR